MQPRLAFAGLLLVFALLPGHAQIGQNRQAIIAEYGDQYESGETDDGTPYISYEKSFTTEQSGTYTQIKALYFLEADDGSNICYKWILIEPSSETNAWVKYLNKEMVKIGYLKWKDYETNINYQLNVEDDYCLLKVAYDFENE